MLLRFVVFHINDTFETLNESRGLSKKGTAWSTFCRTGIQLCTIILRCSSANVGENGAVGFAIIPWTILLDGLTPARRLSYMEF